MADIVQANGGIMTPMEMQIQQQAIDRQRAIATMLQQSSLQSPEGQMVSGHYVAPSATQYLAKLAAGLIGKNQQSDLDQKTRDIATIQGNMMRDQFGLGAQPQSSPNVEQAIQTGLSQGAQAGSVGPTNDNLTRVAQALQSQPQSATPQVGSRVIPGMSPMMAFQLYNSDPKTYDAAYLDQFKLPDAVKTNNYYGLDKGGVADAMARENAAKGQATLRSGNTLTRTNPDGSITPLFTAPDQATGINTQWVNGQPQASAIPGVADIRKNLAAAELAGRNQQTLAPKDMSPTLPNGQVQPTTVANTIGGTAPASAENFPTISPADQRARDAEALKFAQADIANAATSADKQQARQAYDKMLARFNAGQSVMTGDAKSAQGVGPAFGQEAGATNAQTELTKKFSDLQAQNSQAQITSSYLQNIKQQAQKAAVGPMSDKIDYVNGLLSLVGNERAKDAVTANDLLDKYSNQIVSRLGTGGLGTDAARAIIQSAYPNAHMTQQAINEAADNLMGASEMVKAKAKLLAPLGNARDPVTYQQKEMIFDQNADPRIWQYKNLGPGTAQGKAFAASVMQQDQNFAAKIKALESIGAL